MRIVGLLIACLFLMPSISNAFCFEEAGRLFGINPLLLRGIAKVESNLNPNAINRNANGSIDIGLMQVNSSWVSNMGLDPGRLRSDPCYNVMAGSKILKLCVDRYGYTWEAVGCYNAASRSRRVNYSWKVFGILKAEGKKQPLVNGHQSLVKANDQWQMTSDQNQSLVTPSTLSFSVRDNAAIE